MRRFWKNCKICGIRLLESQRGRDEGGTAINYVIEQFWPDRYPI